MLDNYGYTLTHTHTDTHINCVISTASPRQQWYHVALYIHFVSCYGSFMQYIYAKSEVLYTYSNVYFYFEVEGRMLLRKSYIFFTSLLAAKMQLRSSQPLNIFSINPWYRNPVQSIKRTVKRWTVCLFYYSSHICDCNTRYYDYCSHKCANYKAWRV